jgi:glycerate 2-kinase
MRVVVAPDKFKGSLPACDVAAALAAGLRAGNRGLDVLEVPVADGGDGTLAAALAAGFERVPVTACGPTGEPVESAIGMRDASLALVELADVVGLQRLPGGVPAPLQASTFGLGQRITAALDRGAATIIVGVGGSASADGGAGMMQALGLRLVDADGDDLSLGGAALAGLAAIDTTGLDPRIADTTLLLASDVDNPLLGDSGTAAVFGPQKGATGEQISQLDSALAKWAELTAHVTGLDAASLPGAGAAGGTGYAALAYLQASLRPGIDLVLELVGLDAALGRADLVITGEGSLDAQSLRGKTPIGVARAADRFGVPVLAVAGQSSLTQAQLASAGIDAAYPLSALQPDPAVSIRDAPRLLFRIGELIGRQLAGMPLATLIPACLPDGAEK